MRQRWRRRFSRAPMATKLSALVGASIALASFLVVIFQGTGQYLLAQREFSAHLAQQAGLAAQSFQAAVVFEDAKAIEELAGSFVADTHIISVLVEKDGKRLFAWNRVPAPWPEEPLLASGVLTWASNANSLVGAASAQVLMEGKPVATVQLVRSFRGEMLSLVSRLLVLMAAAFIATLLMIVLMRRLVHKLILPLEHLAEVMFRVSRDRSWGLRADVETEDEVGQLGQIFNRLLEQVQDAHFGLHKELEVRKRTESRFQHLAMHDPMTGLPNRVAFGTELTSALHEVTLGRRTATVLFVDLDNFKYVNDTLGHAAGDEVLRCVADRLRQAVRSSDVVARLGGDEFAVLLSDVANPQAALDIAAKIIESVMQPIPFNGKPAYVGCSIGVRQLDPTVSSSEVLLSQADAAMYSAKARGKGQAVLFERQMQERQHGAANIAQRLHEALDRNALTTHFQPLYNCATKQLAGFEALARWPGGPGPAQFIAVAEESGQIQALGNAIFDQAFAAMADWATLGREPVVLAINISAAQIFAPRFVEHLLSRCERFAIAPAMVELEITESLLLPDLNLATDILQELKQHGFSIAIDDFGTGYSAINYLKVLPVSKLKLDRGMINGITQSLRDRNLVKAMIDMALALYIQVVAEGVETQDELDLLTEMGCHFVQGYLLGRPAPMADHIRAISHDGFCDTVILPESITV